MAMDPSPIAAYLRDSGGEEQELSLDQQETAIRRWCLENNFLLTKIYRDQARPGSTAIGREAFLTMMDYFRRPDCPEVGLVIWKYSRFARDIDDAQFYKADLRRHGFKIISINDNIPEGPEGRFFEAAIDWMNQRFLLDLSTDVKRGLRELVEKHGCLPGTPPRGFKRQPVHLGYHRNGVQHIAHCWVPDPEIIPLVQRAFQMRAAGQPLVRIHNETRLYSSINSYTTFFTNPLYIGILKYGDLKIENYCQPIIDPQTWRQVQALVRKYSQRLNLQGDNPDHPRRLASSYLLSGIAYCAKCNSPLYGKSSKQRNGNYCEEYGCSRRRRRRDCSSRDIPRRPFETAVIETLRQFILRPEHLQALNATHFAQQHNRQLDLDKKRSDLKKQLSILKRQITNLTSAIAETGHTRALLNRLTDLENSETELLTQLAQLDQQKINPLPPPTMDQTTKMVDRIIENLKTSDPETQRATLKNIIHRVSVERDGRYLTGIITYYTPYPPPPSDHSDPPGPSDPDKTASIFQTPVGAPLHTHSFTSPLPPRHHLPSTKIPAP
jgi:DNA invertase Pin-like site-specific DNA recombinase